MDVINLATNYFFIFIGIVSSIALPVLRQALPKPIAGKWLDGKNTWQRVGEVVKPYLIVFATSLVVGVLVLAFAGELLDWKSSLLAGFTWDSLIQKVQTKQAALSFN